LYLSASIIRTIKSRRISWAWNGGRRGKLIGYWWGSREKETVMKIMVNIKMDLGEIGLGGGRY
jgi:hypothetical protein